MDKFGKLKEVLNWAGIYPRNKTVLAGGEELHRIGFFLEDKLIIVSERYSASHGDSLTLVDIDDSFDLPLEDAPLHIGYKGSAGFLMVRKLICKYRLEVG